MKIKKVKISNEFLDESDFFGKDEQRMLNKKYRDEARYVTFDCWPVDDIKILYVDGNNILFLTQILRQNTLGRKKIKSEKIIVGAVEEFCSINHFDTVIVIFDSTHEVYEKILENGTKFVVTSAKPQYQSSDDALVIFNEKQNEDIRNKSLVVSSDVALCGRLCLLGTLVMKCKPFFDLILKTMNRTTDLNEWFTNINESLQMLNQ